MTTTTATAAEIDPWACRNPRCGFGRGGPCRAIAGRATECLYPAHTGPDGASAAAWTARREAANAAIARSPLALPRPFAGIARSPLAMPRPRPRRLDRVIAAAAGVVTIVAVLAL